jgi:3'(2'), 5'-bisphosphate nucleotidase
MLESASCDTPRLSNPPKVTHHDRRMFRCIATDHVITDLLEGLTDIAMRSSAVIMSFAGGGLGAERKADGSAVTQADRASEDIILEALAKLAPDVPIISEERFSSQNHAALGDEFFLVDPLDGTREFIAGRAEFVVNLALIRRGVPVAGVVAAPALQLIWRGGEDSQAERLQYDRNAIIDRMPIRTRAWPAHGAIALTSRSHLDQATLAFLQRLPQSQERPLGSAIKFCRLAEGSADVYPRLAQTSEWDIAAGHAVLSAAGGAVLATNGEPLTYGRMETRLRVPSFIAWGDPQAATRLGGV